MGCKPRNFSGIKATEQLYRYSYDASLTKEPCTFRLWYYSADQVRHFDFGNTPEDQEGYTVRPSY